jgi:2Fe-2S ferredoxin
MPEVVFLSAGAKPEELLRVLAPDGGSLADLCDDHSAPVEFSCRSASCGTCRVRVLEGAELLLPAAEDEDELLVLFGQPSSTTPRQPVRLACQVRMREGPGCIIIGPADDPE